jgi:anti-anti-sigma regulatory factor
MVGSAGDTVWAKVEGRATFQISPGLKKYSADMMRRGFRRFVVDLQDCETMDSTFMGTLAGISLHLAEIGQGDLKVIHANSRTASLLSNLGLDQIFEVIEAGADTPAGRPAPDPKALTEANGVKLSEEEVRKQMLDAHQALVAAEPQNAVRFQNVIEVLEQAGTSGESSGT